jgi:hypothetical protein
VESQFVGPCSRVTGHRIDCVIYDKDRGTASCSYVVSTLLRSTGRLGYDTYSCPPGQGPFRGRVVQRRPLEGLFYTPLTDAAFEFGSGLFYGWPTDPTPYGRAHWLGRRPNPVLPTYRGRTSDGVQVARVRLLVARDGKRFLRFSYLESPENPRCNGHIPPLVALDHTNKIRGDGSFTSDAREGVEGEYGASEQQLQGRFSATRRSVSGTYSYRYWVRGLTVTRVCSATVTFRARLRQGAVPR